LSRANIAVFEIRFPEVPLIVLREVCLVRSKAAPEVVI
jgi:hypothetical protein